MEREAENKMDEIISYLVEEKGETIVVAKILAQNLCKYEDIKEAFLIWLENRTLQTEPEIRGYNPVKIHEVRPELEPVGIYQFLVTLRESPDRAEQIINSNFAQK
ncbi:hypothetical protein [Blautia sp. RTP21359st1_E11_RTP21359_211015]|mgnify:CR=1 FL=1|uniref:hypothetical protein n=1 Tax=Blautia sp. RTP21359st1_E11_RTP21359_211015 TaxID=3141591 RepID=UPI0034A42E0C